MGHVFAEDTGDSRWFRGLVRAIYRIALKHPRMKVIFQNEEHRSEFLQHGWVRAHECVLIPGSGVDTSAFVPGSRSGDPPLVILASRMLYTKGVAEFVEAARLLRRESVAARFILVGEPDPDNPASIPDSVLRDWAGEGVVEYEGRQENMPEIFKRADIACLPSYYGEGIPKVLVEAASCALPIVTTDWPGCRDVVVDESNGLVVPVKDSVSLAAALRRLIENPQLRRVMGDRGRARAMANFSLDRVLRDTLRIYEELTR
jgi:glycosyltransferase involved in cell wall biosynthesis